MDLAERQALTTLCAQLTELRTEFALRSEHHQRLLAQIETEARAQRPILELLRQLRGSNEDTRQILSGGLPGLSPGHADEESFGCPGAACERVCATLPAGPIPRCHLTANR